MQRSPKILIIGENSFIGNSYQKYSDFKYCVKVSLKQYNLEDVNFKGYDTILHFPAIVHQSSKIPYEKYRDVNTNLAYRTAKKAKNDGVRQFVFFSTIRIYGEYTPGNVVWNESTKPSPTDNYGRSKLEAENKLRPLNDSDFHIVILRIPMVYGPGNRGNINKMISLIDKFYCGPFSNIDNERNILYIKNLVEFIDKVIAKDGYGTFLVTDPKPVSTTEIAHTISKYLDKKVLLMSIPILLRRLLKFFWKAGYYKVFGNLKLDSTASYEKMNYQPKYNFEQGMKEMMEWYKNQSI
jgi:UDP-glucose 4-epimerase